MCLSQPTTRRFLQKPKKPWSARPSILAHEEGLRAAVSSIVLKFMARVAIPCMPDKEFGWLAFAKISHLSYPAGSAISANKLISKTKTALDTQSSIQRIHHNPMNRFFRFLGGLPPSDGNEDTVQTFLLLPMLRNYLIPIFSLGVALGAGLSNGMNYAATYHENRLEEIALTRAEYGRVTMQMSLTQVEAILGRGTEISQAEDFIVFEWKNQNGSSMTAVFEYGYLVQKSQTDL